MYVDRNLKETHLPFIIPMGQDISFAKIFEKYISETQKIGQNTCCLNENSARPTAYFLHWAPRRILSAAATLTLCKLTPRRADAADWGWRACASLIAAVQFWRSKYSAVVSCEQARL